MITQYATVLPYWPDVVAAYFHKLIHFLGYSSLTGVVLFGVIRVTRKFADIELRK